MTILELQSELNLHTRRQNQVQNEINRRPSVAGDALACKDYEKQYPKALHRPSGPSRQYNCHGLTFAARRTVIWKASEVAKVINDDEYVRIELKDVLPGDVALYYSGGDVEHSGIVVANVPVPLILSKWGKCHEVVHKVHECPYDSSNVIYYRIVT